VEGRGVSPALRRIWSAPSLRALSIQCVSFPLMLLAVFVLARAGVRVSYLHVALVQGAIAALLSWRLARWWRAIQFLFPLALLGANALALAPGVFLGGFIVLLLVFWSTFRTQVPYYPSTPKVREALAGLLPPDRPVRMIDVGSGLGGLVLELARRRQDCLFDGIELAPLPWLASRVRALLAGTGVRFLRGDYEKLDFGQYDLVFAYLSPAAMDALWAKASSQMRPGTLLVSYEFPVIGQEPDRKVLTGPASPPLYIWHF
jgi:SAM-dependent methyltransferase